MSDYRMQVEWSRGGSRFTDNRYSRAHVWRFDGGAVVPASSSPSVVPLPLSAAENVDPEEAFVAALSSCHMLSFLHIAAKRGYTVDSYRDEAAGHMAKNEAGKLAMIRVTLYPKVRFSGDKVPTDADLTAMHEEAHHECFIANSVRTVVETEGTWEYAADSGLGKAVGSSVGTNPIPE